jgi:hypothetical protein
MFAFSWSWGKGRFVIPSSLFYFLPMFKQAGWGILSSCWKCLPMKDAANLGRRRKVLQEAGRPRTKTTDHMQNQGE